MPIPATFRNSEPPAAGWPLEMGSAEFDKARRLIGARAGIVLADHKRQMVFNRLARRLRALQLGRFADYLRLLDDDKHPEWEQFVSALTTNITAFFRETHHFDLLCEHFPATGEPPSLIWSAGCSTGEEPYSIAMVLEETFGLPRLLEKGTRILATDIDGSALKRAADGIYPASSVQPLPVTRVSRHFAAVPGQPPGRQLYRFQPALAALVQFRQLNLVAPRWGMPFDARGFDAIFCRNVMIYFDHGTQLKLVKRFAKALDPSSPAGLLFAGHSEMLLHSGEFLEALGQTTYCLKAPKPVRGAAAPKGPRL